MKLRLVRIALFLLIGLIGLWLSTQSVARGLQYHPDLGEPLITVGELSIYSPWKIVQWEREYGKLFKKTFQLSYLYLFFSMLPAVGASILLGCLSTGKTGSTAYGSSRWATEEEIKKRGLYNAKGVVLGIDSKKRYLTDDSSAHVMMIATTRSGKGEGMVKPTLVTYPGSALILDPKGENWAQTSAERALFSDVVYINPSQKISGGFNPLFEIRKGDYEIKDTQNIAGLLVDPNGKGELNHWDTSARQLLTGAILHVLYSGTEKTLAGVAKLLSNPKLTIEETLEMMMNAAHMPDGSTHERVASIARNMLNKSVEERSGVLSTALNTLDIYGDKLVAAATSRSDFRIEQFQYGTRPLSVYLVFEGADTVRLKPLVRLIIGLIMQRSMERLDWKEEWVDEYEKKPFLLRLAYDLGLLSLQKKLLKYSAAKPQKMLLVLDEFPLLGKIEFFEAALAYMAQYGIRAVLAYQSKGQLFKDYGQDNSLLDNCTIKVFHTAASAETAEWISRMAGQTTDVRRHRNFGGKRHALFLDHVTEGDHEMGRPLITSDEVMRLGEDGQVIFVLNLHPIQCEKVKFSTDPTFEAMRREMLDLSKRTRFSLSGPPPRSDWEPESSFEEKRFGSGRVTANEPSEISSGELSKEKKKFFL